MPRSVVHHAQSGANRRTDSGEQHCRWISISCYTTCSRPMRSPISGHRYRREGRPHRRDRAAGERVRLS
jgi:hypothetical protein